MSQVIRKYNSGGLTNKPKLLSVNGLGDFNQEDLINRGYRDIDEYASSRGLRGAALANFRNSVQYILEGIDNGTMTMDAMGNFRDATGQKSSTGELDRRKFMGIKTRVKNTENNAYGLAANYLYNIIKDSPQYRQPEVKKGRFNTNDYLTGEISKNWYGGNKVDFNNWFKNRNEQDRNALIGEIFSNADYNQLYQAYDWKGTGINSAEDLANRGRAFGLAIANNKLDNDDYNTFAALGGSDLDKFLKQQTETPKQDKVDTSWTHPDYDRIIDDKGKYHIYKKGTNEEVNGILPGNVFEGVGNKYIFDGNLYDDSNLPEQYRQDINRARQAQLGEYTSLTDNNPFTKMLRGQGYNYITNLSKFASSIGDNILYGAYSNPSDVNGKMSFYLKNPTTNKTTKGLVEFNKSLGEYQFIGEDGNVINLGAYNPNGTRERQGAKFVDYTDTSKNNLENLFNTWMLDTDLSNSASEAYRMVQNTLSKWIDSKQSPFMKYGNNYKWAVGDNDMNVTRNNDGTLSWYFNDKVENDEESNDELQRLLSIPINKRSREINDRILELKGYKEGGVISAQLGTKFTEDTTPLKVNAVQPDAELIERNTKARQSFTDRSNISIINNEDITNAGGVIKTSDKVRLGAAMADLASIGLGFVPGANFASAGIGAGASITEFGADWASDGLDLGDIGRLGMNLGMDALSLIPVGKTLKATKALGKIRKSIPLIMTAINTLPFLDPTIRSEYSKTLSKLTKGDLESLKSLNTGDFKNLSAIASTILMGKNLVKSHKGWWNSSTTPSGKRRVTAMIDGKQQTLEVDDAFFQNTKGKNQVSELKTKFAEQYNKANKLEGDKAIKPENVSVDTKYFGRRPQSEKIEGTETNGNWLSNSRVGKHLVGYRDPSVVRGKENIPFSDAWFLKRKSSSTPSPSVTQPEGQGEAPLLMLPAPGQTNRVFTMGAGKPKVPQDVTNPSNLRKLGSYTDRAVPVGGTPVQSPDANAVRTVNTINSILEPFVPKSKNLPAVIPASRNAQKVVASQTIQPTQRLDQFIEGQIPGGRLYGRQRAKTEREYRDVFHPATEREYNQAWDEAIRGRKDFGYEEVFPRRSIYAPPTPTEVYIVPEVAMKNPNARYLWEFMKNGKFSTLHIKRKKRKTSRGVAKKAEGGVVQFLQDGRTINLEQTPVKLPEVIIIANPSNTNPSDIKRTTSKKGKGFNLGVMPEDVIALGRMVGGLVANNKAAELYKEGLKPTLLDTFENTIPLQGNFQAKSSAEQQAADLESMAARPRTSDASLQLAGELEASSRAGQARFQGGLQDAEMFYKTRMLGQQESDAAKARRVETANRNRASMNQIDAAKKQIDAARVTSNYQNVIAPYLAGVENRFAQKRAINRQLDMEEVQRKAERIYSPEFDRLANDYNTAYKAYGAANNNDYTGWETSDEYKSLVKRRKSLDNKISQFLLDKRREIVDFPYMFQVSSTKTPSAKSGGKLSDKEKLQRVKDFNKRLLEDNKQFHKDIMESKREYNKLIMSISSLTSKSIKKAMS